MTGGRLTLRAAASALTALTVALSVGPETESVGGVQLSDKLLHVGVYALLAFLFVASEMPSRSPWRHIGAITSALILLGASLELVQFALPHRSAEPFDLLANTAGIASGIAVARGLQGPLHRCTRRY